MLASNFYLKEGAQAKPKQDIIFQSLIFFTIFKALQYQMLQRFRLITIYIVISQYFIKSFQVGPKIAVLQLQLEEGASSRSRRFRKLYLQVNSQVKKVKVVAFTTSQSICLYMLLYLIDFYAYIGIAYMGSQGGLGSRK